MAGKFEAEMMNIRGKPASLIVGNPTTWAEGFKYGRHAAAEIACQADIEIDKLLKKVDELEQLLEMGI